MAKMCDNRFQWRASVALLVALVSSNGRRCASFVPRTAMPLQQHNGGTTKVVVTDSSSTTTTALSAMPPLIIGPMIRKMREGEAKKRMPMAQKEERVGESPGLRVGPSAWKWPPVWPYEDDFFYRPGDKISVVPDMASNPMAMMMNGGMGAPPVPEVMPEAEERMDSIEFWSVENADATIELGEVVRERLQNHYGFYLDDGMSVLELGAGDDSYLPEDLQLERLVGVGADTSAMAKNTRLTESMVVDLNKVIPDMEVDSDELRALGSDTFDAIIMANTIDFLTEPREVFKSAWRLLKPGGIMMVPFSGTDAYSDRFGKAQTKMWTNYNDDQHMWVTGSFFQFSAGEGWEGLKGFDLSPKEAVKSDVPVIGRFLDQGKPSGMYIVQATKAFPADSISDTDPEKSFRSLLWMAPTLEDRDKKLIAPRLARTYMLSSTSERKERVKENVETLPKLYEQLTRMDQFAFPFSLQAQLAADVASDPGFDANEEQLKALRMGLGLAKPSEEFWLPVGQLTGDMEPEDKVNLLAYIVPRFGTGDAAQEEALGAFVSGFTSTFDVVRAKCPTMAEGDVQLVGTELLAAEVLIPGRSTREEFASWLGMLSADEIEGYLAKRKGIKTSANTELQAMKDQRQAEEDARKEKLRLYEEQKERAQKERTMAFNPETGKIEPVKKK